MVLYNIVKNAFKSKDWEYDIGFDKKTKQGNCVALQVDKNNTNYIPESWSLAITLILLVLVIVDGNRFTQSTSDLFS